jgi:hypothetical protein
MKLAKIVVYLQYSKVFEPSQAQDKNIIGTSQIVVLGLQSMQNYSILLYKQQDTLALLYTRHAHNTY